MTRPLTSTPQSIEEVRRKASVRLSEVGGIKFGEFTLTSGKTSPYYVDLRIVPSYPDLFEKFMELCAKTVDNIEGVERLAGVPTSGLPFSAVLAVRMGIPLLYPRKEEKVHGTKKTVEGVLRRGDDVCIVDDVATTGGSIEEASETIRQAGGSVEHSIVLLDREEGAESLLNNTDIKLHSCLKISELIKHLKESSELSEKKYSLVLDYLKGRP